MRCRHRSRKSSMSAVRPQARRGLNGFVFVRLTSPDIVFPLFPLLRGRKSALLGCMLVGPAALPTKLSYLCLGWSRRTQVPRAAVPAGGMHRDRVRDVILLRQTEPASVIRQTKKSRCRVRSGEQGGGREELIRDASATASVSYAQPFPSWPTACRYRDVPRNPEPSEQPVATGPSSHARLHHVASGRRTVDVSPPRHQRFATEW